MHIILQRAVDAAHVEAVEKARGLLPGRFGRGQMRSKFNDRAMKHLQRADAYAAHARDSYRLSPNASHVRDMNAAVQREMKSSNRYDRAVDYLQSRRHRKTS